MDAFCIIDSDGRAFHSNVDLDFSYKEIDEWKHKWNPAKHVDRNGLAKPWGFVTYKVINTSVNFPENTFEDTALAIALRQWGFRCKDIRFKRIYDSERADIELKFTKAEDDKMFKERPSTLAYAYFPNGTRIGGDITFNDSVLWSTNGKPVNAHEVKPEVYKSNTKTKHTCFLKNICDLNHPMTIRICFNYCHYFYIVSELL